MKHWIRERLILLLFTLLGEPTRLLDGVSVVTKGKHAVTQFRKKEWQRALATLWDNKPLIDFLSYQAENDKENVWKGKVSRETAQGARIRTLFIIYQSQKAHMMRRMKRDSSPDIKDGKNQALQKLEKTYKSLVDM